jgi:hypothetical protein
MSFVCYYHSLRGNYKLYTLNNNLDFTIILITFIKFLVSILITSSLIFSWQYFFSKKLSYLKIFIANSFAHLFYLFGFIVEGILESRYQINASEFTAFRFVPIDKTSEYFYILESLVIWDFFYVILLTTFLYRQAEQKFVSFFLDMLLLNIILTVLWMLCQILIILFSNS